MILLSISLLAIVAAFFVYRKKPLQFILRAAAVLFMYLVISNYQLRLYTDVSHHDPIVLIDYSKSMENSLEDIIETVSKIDYPHRTLFVQESLIIENRPDRLGSYTNLTKALRESDRMHSSSIFLITDGNHNSGVSPLTVIKDMVTPVYVCGAGPDGARDIAIVDIKTPAYAYQDDSIHIDVIVESNGFPSGECQVSVELSSGRKVATQTIPLSESRARRRLRFGFTTDVIGESRVNISVTPVSGESTYDNNKQSVLLNVIKSKIQVLYYTDHISFNTKFLRQRLTTDDHISLSSFTRSGTNQFFNLEHTDQANARPNPATYDVIILDNANIGRPLWSRAEEYLKEGKGLVLIGTIEGINASWQRIIPIDIAGGVITGTHRLQITESFSALKQEDYPPVSLIGRAVGSKDDATIIAYAGNIPVIAYRREGRGIVYQISIIDLARWSFMQHGVKGRERLGQLIGDIIRFLSHFGDHERLVLNSQKRDYAAGETVNLNLQSYDRDLRPAGGGDFYLAANDGEVPFYEIEYGHYETSTVFEIPGRYQVWAKGNLDDEQLSSSMIEVNISSRPLEVEQNININLLERIATGTNGEFFSLEELANIVPPESSKKQISRVFDFNSPITYVLVLTLLIVDWVLRRRRGIT
ncbi:MAG: hypothetical protein JSV98_03460 [candidate division WOR-3 bacterium]|nr:MAG: hypothetical protein JSV98_03460 [candidate division WOR-3 bacterium]